MSSQSPLRPLYPDVLGQITGGPRINMDAMEVAVGIYPKVAFINQPVEMVIVMQSMVDRDLQLKVAIRTPNVDRNGNDVNVKMAKSSFAMKLGPGEVGVLRMPLVAQPPTKPSTDLPVRLALRFRVKGDAEYVRPPGGGSPPTVLTVSPFKLQVLKDVEFIAHKWNESVEILTANFSVSAKTLPNDPGNLSPAYEALWTQEGLREEIQLAQAQFDEAMDIAQPGTTGNLYPAFMNAVEERFGIRGMPLHPGETMAIAKMMTYTVEDAPTREPGMVLEDMLWFRALCQVLAANPELVQFTRAEIISKHVFDTVLYESVLIGFKVMQGRVKEDLGSESERVNFANRIMQWFSGHGEGDLTYVYLPLVLGGITIARVVRSNVGDNRWLIADAMDEAFAGRVELMHGENIVIFDMLDILLEDYKALLRARRVLRPEQEPQTRVNLPRDVLERRSDNSQDKPGKGTSRIRRLSDD